MRSGHSVCADSDKSELVRKLEAIFDNPSFAKISETVFNVADYGASGNGTTLAATQFVHHSSVGFLPILVHIHDPVSKAA